MKKLRVCEALHGGDARKLLAGVVGIASAVVGGVQPTVDVVKQVFFGDRAAPSLRFLRKGWWSLRYNMFYIQVSPGELPGV